MGAESTRDARAKVIASEGEQKAAKALKEAADVISQSPAALQLRYLQTLNSISAEKNSTIIFPLPMELVGAFTQSGVRKRNWIRQRTKVPYQPILLPLSETLMCHFMNISHMSV